MRLDKVLTLSELVKITNEYKSKNKKIVTINGCFDMLQLGHIKILYEAKKQGDFLIVGLNSDASVKRLKGNDRPINDQSTRCEVMAALQMVDFVFVFDEDDPRAFLNIIRPHIHVNDASYGVNCVESEILNLYGGKLHLVEKFNVPSTTQTIEKIKQVYK